VTGVSSMNRKCRSLISPLAVIIATVAAFAGGAFAGSDYQVIHRFSQYGPDGHYPTELIADTAGNLYGMTLNGGAYGFGTVFELKFPAKRGGEWRRDVLYNLPVCTPLHGYYGPATLVVDEAGNVYGTCPYGGNSSLGFVFKLTPPLKGETRWRETAIHSFNGWDGSGPNGLALDSAGNVYGTTFRGGRYCQAYGCGTVYKLTPQSGRHGRWNRSVLYFFKGVRGGNGVGDGSEPIALTFDNEGNLYGVSRDGGQCGYGCGGTVFKLERPRQPGDVWHESVIYRFAESSSEDLPISGVAIDATGALYGATDYSVYQLALMGGVWTETKIATVNGGYFNGATLDAAGNVYGTGSFALYQWSPPDWTETVLHTFAGGRDGLSPSGNVIFGLDGALYGATYYGGDNQCPEYGNNAGCGTVFKVAP
jgi:uncharacterized repeat protein (TIGR03803 family)